MISARQRQILELIAAGKETQEIATLLGLTENTIKSYLKDCYERLGVNGRVDALRKAGITPVDRSRARQRVAELREPQREVLAMIAAGLPDKQIARQLGASLVMVKYRVRMILAALNVTNRAQAAAMYNVWYGVWRKN